jgi:hypothetical protein
VSQQTNGSVCSVNALSLGIVFADGTSCRQNDTANQKELNLSRLATGIIVWISIGAVFGCSQVPYKASTYARSVTTMIAVESNVPAKVWFSDRLVGTAPGAWPYTYQEEVDLVAGTANYWETNPEKAAALSVLSMGLYVPFSGIAAERTGESKPTGRYLNNELTVKLERDGYETVERIIACRGEPQVQVGLSLKRRELKEGER